MSEICCPGRDAQVEMSCAGRAVQVEMSCAGRAVQVEMSCAGRDAEVRDHGLLRLDSGRDLGLSVAIEH